jgi:hypothetical protein
MDRQQKKGKKNKTVQDDKIGAFSGILLYVGAFLMARNVDYWNYDSKRAVHNLIINCLLHESSSVAAIKKIFENFQPLRG